MNVLEAALRYRELGLPVIPMKKESKIPLVKWKKYQTELPAEQDLISWFTKWPDANIAMVMGKFSKVFAIDLDSREALEYYKATYDMDVEMTMCQMSGRDGFGMHALFNVVGDAPPLITGVLEKTDLKGEGSYIMVEPSIHKSGRMYKWTNLNPLTDGLDDVLDAPPGVNQMVKDYNDNKNSLSESGEYGDTDHVGKPRNAEGWEQELLMGVNESERDVAAAKLAGLYLSKDYGQNDTLILLLRWNERNTPPLPEGEIEKVVKSIYGAHQKEKAQGIAEAVEKIIIYRYPDGTNKYKLCLSGGKYVIVKMADLLSGRRTIEQIADATRTVFNPPKQGRWFDLVRIWLKAAEEEVVAVEESELGVIKEVIAEWIDQWDKQKDSEHVNLATMVCNSCVVEEGVIYFTLAHIEEDLRFRGAKLTRTILCEFLHRLGAKVTEPRRRFNGSRVRTWDIKEDGWK